MLTYPLQTNMTNASLLDELGKSPVNPFPRHVRLSRGVKGGKGFTSELKPYSCVTPVSTRKKISPENEVGSPAGWLAGCLERQERKYHATIFLTYTHTRTSPPTTVYPIIFPTRIFFLSQFTLSDS